MNTSHPSEDDIVKVGEGGEDRQRYPSIEHLGEIVSPN
jgi:hypothetical protein